MKPELPEFIPQVIDESRLESTVIDAALAKNATKEELKKMKAIEYTIVLLKGRTIGPDTIDKTFKTFYNQLNNEQRQ